MDKKATLLHSHLIPQTNGFTAKCGMIFFEEEIIFLVHRHE
jgi:hypothetical protein